MIQIIIFSKDRALQLELLLRSMKEYFLGLENYRVNVLYTYSNENYRLGYEKLKKIHNDIFYKKEKSFKTDLIEMVDQNKKYLMFLVDDIIFKEKFDSSLLKNMTGRTLCFSLRLHPNLERCYALDCEISKKPKFIRNSEFLFFSYSGAQGDYGYPMSVDGNIYHTSDIEDKLKRLHYTGPNELEGALSNNGISKNEMMCLYKSALFNNPCNKVQTCINNSSGYISPLYLNGMFLDGYKIDLEPYRGFENISCHQEVDIRLIKT